MNLDGLVDFAVFAKDSSKRKMGVNDFPVGLDQFDKNIQRLVLLIVEQIIQTLEIFAGEAFLFGGTFDAAPDAPEQHHHDNCRGNQNPGIDLRQIQQTHPGWHVMTISSAPALMNAVGRIHPKVRRRRKTLSVVLLERVVNPFTQFLARFEMRHIFAWQRNRITGFRVTPRARRTVMQ